MVEPNQGARVRIYSSTTVLLVGLVFFGGCPKPAPATAKWTAVTDAKVHEERKLDAFEKKQQERMKAEVAKRNVEKIRLAFVQEEDRGCKIDSDCTVVSHHCCDCSQGGRKDVVNREGFQKLIQRRTFVCEEVKCRQVVSTDESCSATRAQCVEGKCALKIDPNATQGGAEGVGIEPIEDPEPPGKKPIGDKPAPAGKAPAGKAPAKAPPKAP